MLIQIDGWYGGGKSVLWALLDGHKDIFVSPIHEYAFQAFLPYSNSDSWVLQKDTEFLRHILSKTGYYRLEEAYLQKEFDFLISSDNKITIPFKMDFYDFDKKYIQKIVALKVWDISLLCELLYETYYECFNHIPKNGKYPKYYASMGHPQPIESYMNMSKVLPTSKRILIKRDIKEIIATRCTRSITSTGKRIGTPFYDIIKSDEIFNILEYYKEFDRLERENSSQFLSIGFDKLVCNTEEEMLKVSSFLGIDFETILTIPTRNNTLIENRGESLINKKNDRHEELLTSLEIDLIEKEMNLFTIREENNLVCLKETNLIDYHYSIRISTILKKFEDLKRKNLKLMIYGNGYLGRLLANDLGSNLVSIVDKNLNNDIPYQSITIDEIDSYEFDFIIITLLGREGEVMEDIINANIDVKKIVTF